MSAKLQQLAPIFEVPNLDRAVVYYTEKLEFTADFVARHPGLPGYAGLRRDGVVVHLMEREARDPAEVRSGFHALVDDVDALYAAFQAADAFAPDFPRHLDAIREHGPADKEYGQRDIIFVDPNGYILVFGSDLG